MIKTKTFWLKAEKAAPFVILAVLTLTVLNVLLSAILTGLFLTRADSQLTATVNLIPPTISITKPSANQKLTGQAPVTLVYLDGSQFSKIEFFMDEKLDRQVMPFGANEVSFPLDTTKFPDGNHTFSFKAVTNQGKVLTSAVGVVFDNHNSVQTFDY